jgi:energy-converting hydrogenase Eha subunit B
MRYRIGESQPEAGTALDQGAFMGLAVLSFLIGAGFVLAGIRSKHYWLSIWGGGLALCSAIYIGLATFIL